MTWFAKLAALVLITWSLAGAAPTGPDDPASYAVRVPVTVAAGSTVQRVALPAAVLTAARTDDLSDLRIFDATGKAMPMARIAPTATMRRDVLPVLPILGAAEALNVTGVSLRVDGDGRARVAQVVGTPPAGPTRATVLGVLLDARAIDGAAQVLTIDADVPEAQPVSFAIEASADLKTWRPIAEKVIFRSAGDAAATAFPLGDMTLDGDYLRVSWRSTSRLLSPVTIRRAMLTTTANDATVGSSVNAVAPPVTDVHAIEFGLPFATPPAAIRVVPTGSDILVPIRIFGRDDREQPWQFLGEGTASRPSGRGGDDAIGLAGSFRQLRIEADQRSAGFSSAPSIAFDLPRREIVFLAAGQPPFILAAGRAAATDTYLPLASLMTQAAGKQPTTATTVAAADPVLQLKAVDDSGAKGQVLLWAILVGATALLGVIAWRLRGGLVAR